MVSVEILAHLPGFTLDAHWAVEDGVVALFGPSGAGKSLTLHCLAGLLRPDAGRITVRGRTLFDSVRGIHQPTRDRRLGVVFQGFALFPHLTVAENVGFGLHRSKPNERRARVDELLDRLELGPARDLKPHAISGGQQQRTALGRALATDPDLLLLDEPLSALDAPLRRTLRDDLAQTLRGFGKTAIIVTHDLGEACQLADQLVVYERGRVLQVGRKSDVLRRPATRAVAQVLGIRNLLEGEVLEAAPEFIRLGWRGQEIRAANWSEDPALPRVGSRVPFFVRPEHVRLMRKDRYGAPRDRRLNVFEGDLVGETDLGAALVLQFRLSGGTEPSRGYDLEIEVSRLAHEKLHLHYVRQWSVSVQPSAVQLLEPRTIR